MVFGIAMLFRSYHVSQICPGHYDSPSCYLHATPLIHRKRTRKYRDSFRKSRQKKCKELSDNCNHQEIENKEECFYRKKYGVVKDSRQGQIVATPER